MSQRLSSYSTFFYYPEIEAAILLHGYTGAIDLVQEKIADLLDPSHGVTDIPYVTRRTLIDRGYLTQRKSKEEKEHVLEMLTVLRNKLEPRTNFVIEPSFPPDQDRAEVRIILASYFEIMDGLKSSSSYNEVMLDLRKQDASNWADVLDLVIVTSNDWKLNALIDEINFSQVAPYVSQHSLREVYVYSTFEQEAFDERLASAAASFEPVLDKGGSIVWLIRIDGLSSALLERLVRRSGELKSRWPHGFSFLLVSSSPPQEGDGGVKVGEKFFTALDLEEVFLYRRIKRFFHNPTLLINFEPCFYRGDQNFRFSEGRLYLSSGPNGSYQEVGDCRAGSVSIDYQEIEGRKASLGFAEVDKQMASCPFCLICGCAGSDQEDVANRESLCDRFGERLHRVLPPLFYTP